MQKKCVIKDRCLQLLTLLILSIGMYSAFGNTKGSYNYFDLAAYQHRIKGVVVDSNGIPIQGVNIRVKGTSRGTFTNNEGVFYMEAAPSDVLVFSYIGFKPLEVIVGNEPELSVVLEDDVTDLGAVTVNAGYYTVSERERTGSISRITASDIESQPISNPIAAMQGQMSGVLVTQSTGIPGSGFDIQIRGQNSIRSEGNEPLYIIDGVPYGGQSLGYNQVSTVLGGGVTISPLNSLNPNDIASIEVLKDADATAIYGSKGANGVVLITTKKGKVGETTFNVSVQSGMGSVTRYMDMMETPDYLNMRREAYVNDGITEYPINAFDINGTWDQNRYTDWQKTLIGGTAYYQNLQASLSAGSAHTNFLISGGYQKQTNVFPGDHYYQKGSVHTQINHRSKDDRFTVTFSSSYIADGNNQAGSDLTRDAITLPPNAPELYDAQGGLNWENGTWNNPLRYLEGRYKANTYNLIANSVLNYKLVWGLELKASLGYNDNGLEEQKIMPNTIYNPAWGRDSRYSYVYRNNGKRNSWIVEPQLHWNKAFNELDINALIGTTFQKQRSEQMAQYASGFSNNSLMENLAAATNHIVLNDWEAIYLYQAVFGRINLNWKSKYILNLTGRRDGSSRFGPGNRFANFGAVGAAWIFSEEAFLKNQRVLSFGKLKFSYGTTGNDQIGDYQYLDTYSTTATNYNAITGLMPTRLFNPDFGWEVNKKLEGGVDLGLIGDRIRLHVGYYRNRSSNQLVGIPLPGITGFKSIQGNLNALVENEGWEWELETRNFQNNHFNWTTSVNLTFNRNELVEYPGLEESTYANSLVIGEPLNIQKLYTYTGINTELGNYEFQDVNQDGLVSFADDGKYIANLNPEFFGGITNSLNYKGWELSFLLQFVKQQGYGFVWTSPRPGTMFNQPLEVLDRWREPGDETVYQAYSTGANSNLVSAYSKYQYSSAMLSDASYIRLKNFLLGYRLPEGVLGAASMRLFVQGQNLFTLTGYDGGDPETQSISNLPPLRILTLGINLQF